MKENYKELVEQLVALNKSRADYYRRLAHYYFKELTQDDIETLANQDFTGLDAGDELLAKGYADMKAYLRRRNSGTREKLAADYAHTFLAAGNYETFAATPYESVFTSELGLMMQEPRDEVYKVFCSEHIQPDETLHMPEDHLSFEFEFIANMLDRMNEALQQQDWLRASELAHKVKDFHANHQLNWIDDLCDTIEDVANTRFYRGVASVTRGFIHMETEVIDDESEVIEEIIRDQAAALQATA